MNTKSFISLFIAVPLFFQSSIVSTNAASLFDFQDSDSTGRPTQTQNINTTRTSNRTSSKSNAPPGFFSDLANSMSTASRTKTTRTTITSSTSTADDTNDNETDDEEGGAASNEEDATESENGDETSTVYAE